MKKLLLIIFIFVCNIINAQTLINTDTVLYDTINKSIEANNHIKKINSNLSVLSLSNDIPANATLITACATSFTATNYGASAEGCGTYFDNVDCNNSTGIYGGGSDVVYTVEADIWYKFCPLNTGTWTVSITPSGCSTSKGYQYSILSGTPTNFSGIYTSNGGPNPSTGWTGTRTINLNVTSTTNCIYLQLDGYAGCQCNFSITINNSTCTLPIELISFNGFQDDKKIKLNWVTATEINNHFFYIERSNDAITWNKIAEVEGAGNSLTTRYYTVYDTEPLNGYNYYRLTQVDFDGQSKTFNIIAVSNIHDNYIKSIKYTNILGQVIEKPDGIYLEIIEYNNGNKIINKKVQN